MHRMMEGLNFLTRFSSALPEPHALPIVPTHHSIFMVCEFCEFVSFALNVKTIKIKPGQRNSNLYCGKTLDQHHPHEIAAQ